jgi:hypothetical protein
MQSSGSAGKPLTRTISGAVLIALVVLPPALSLIQLLAHYSTWIYLNHVCLARTRSFPGSTAIIIPAIFEWSKEDKACHRYLQSYFTALGKSGPVQLETARSYEKEADTLVGQKGFSTCMERLHSTASLIENTLNLPLLSEAFERCAVAECRRRATESRTANGSSLDQRRALYFLLADHTIDLAKLFCQHGKIEIADRAYQDAIASAQRAAAGDMQRVDKIQRYYFAYAEFLLEQRRDDEALYVFSKMDGLSP